MNKISHTGIVEAIEGTQVCVRIVQTSACAACKAASHCSASESKEKVIAVDDPRAAATHQVGDQVSVAMPAGNGRDAVLIAFVMPFVILVVVLGVTLALTHHEGMAALAGIASLIPYYAVVYLCRGKLAGKFSFVIEN